MSLITKTNHDKTVAYREKLKISHQEAMARLIEVGRTAEQPEDVVRHIYETLGEDYSEYKALWSRLHEIRDALNSQPEDCTS